MPGELSAPHWHILGAGAIGGLLAACLLDGGVKTTLLLRDRDRLRAWERNPVLLVQSGDGAPRPYHPGVSVCADPGAIRHLVLCTKAHEAEAALHSILPRLQQDAVVLLLCNGMGLAETLSASCPAQDLVLGTTTEAAFRLATFHVVHAGRGITHVGIAGREQPPAWFARWRRLDIDCRWEPRIERALWRKLAVNCAINPLTAVHQCPNGALAEEPLASQVSELCTEIAALLAARGFPDLGEHLAAEVREVIAATASNRSSMYQDIRAGRASEIDYITGFLLRQAQLLELDLPANRRLFERVRELEQRR